MSPQDSGDRRERAVRTPPVQRHAVLRAQWESQLLARLRIAAGHLSFSQIGQLTGVHPETVRRYMTYGRPSAFFVAAIGRALAVPLDWLIHGMTDVVVTTAPVHASRNGVAAPPKPSPRITTVSGSLSRGAGVGRTRRLSGSR